MKCKYCNAEVAPNARFCTSCGGDLSKFDKCVNCGEYIDKGASTCPHCGTEQPQLVQPQKSGSKKWLWIIGAIILLCILGGGGYYFFMSDTLSYESENVVAQVEETAAENEKKEEDTPRSAMAFLGQFYKGEFGDDYIRKHVTANVISKLKRDFDYDCPSNDCLATWVFTAYPAGADLDLEEGPIITKTNIDGKFKISFKYSGYSGNQKTFETRTVFLTVIEMDGKYQISDYEFEDVEIKEEKAGLLSFEDALIVTKEMIIKNGSFNGFQSPEKVENIMDKYGYRKRKRYYVYRAFNFEPLYYKNCSFEETAKEDYAYSEVPSAGEGGTPSFVGIDNTNIVIELFTKKALDDFINQMKERGALLKEDQDGNSNYELGSYSISVFTNLAWGLHYCIMITKE